jgi:hypothetical protein
MSGRRVASVAEAIGALPLAAVCLARVAVWRQWRLSALRAFWHELSLAAAAVLAALATTVVDHLIPGLGGRGDLFAAGDLVADVTVLAVAICVVTYFTLFKINNIYAAHEIGPVLWLGAALAGRRFGGPLTRACGLAAGARAAERAGRVLGGVGGDGRDRGRRGAANVCNVARCH